MKLRQLAAGVLRRLGGENVELRIERRVARMDTHQLVSWAETTVPGIGRALDDWALEGKATSLDEARMGTASLLIVLEELEHRREAGRG